MAVFVPVAAVLASGFLADAVSAAPIADQSYANGLAELDDEKMASIFSAIGNVLRRPGVAGGILGTFGALAGGVGSVLGATGQKRDVAFEDMNDEEKVASIFSAIGNVLKKPGVAGGILGTFGALAGGIGSVLGSTGHKRALAEFENMTDEEKVASFWKYIPDIAGAIGGALGLGAGAYQHIKNGQSKRNVAYEDLSKEDVEKMASIFSAITNVLKRPGVAGGILGTFGALAGGVGSVLGATGHKRALAEFENMTDEEKEASFWKFIPDIAGAIGGVLGLGAGAYQHHQNGKQKRAADELTSLLAQAEQVEDKEAFWKLVPAIAGAIGGALGLGAGVHQHIQNGKRAVHPHEINQLFSWKGLKGLFGIKRRDLEDVALLARMIDESEFY